MSTFLGTIQLLIGCGSLILLAFMILLAMPNSELKKFLMPIIGWCLAIFCGIYCVSPVDIVPEAFLGPFGLVDDIGAAVLGFSAASMARKAAKE